MEGLPVSLISEQQQLSMLHDCAEYLGGAILAECYLCPISGFKDGKAAPVELQGLLQLSDATPPTPFKQELIFGYVALVEGMVARFRAELGQEMHVVATGGHVRKIAAHTDSIQHVEPWLTLEGLRLIWEMNQ